MSASLVGSEMCIRDSLAASLPRCQGTRLLTTSMAVLHFRRDLSNPFPVSYTHLTLPTICSV
eukprot:481384-Alexandrium_andersonii.AAC.1